MSFPIPLAISIPQTFPDGSFDPAAMKGYLARAEALGFDSAWVQEQILGAMPSLDPVDMLTYASACTERMRLGCAVLLTSLRSPVHVAKNLSTVDQLSRGRLIVGVGLGAQTGIYPAYAADAETRVARFTEGLRLMKALWTEPRVTFDGRFWKLKDAAMEPKPFHKPYPPLWFGGSHPSALRRAVTYGDGFMGAGGTSTVQFAGQVRTLRSLLDEAGRDPASFPISKRVYVAVDSDRDRAWRRLSEWFGARYGRTSYEDVAVYGSADECAKGLRQVAAAGAGLILCTALFDEAEQLEHIAADIAPRLA